MAQNKKQNYKTILRRILLVVLGLLMGVSFYFVNARSLSRGQLPMPFGTGVAVVLSGSMEPELMVGDLIIVQKKTDYEVGDIVVYQDKLDLIVHRIVEKDGDEFVTQGDANPSPDDPISVEFIQGVVVFHIPFVGSIVNFLHTPVGIIVILALAILLIEGSFSKEKRVDDEEKEAIKEEIRRLKEKAEENEKE